MVHIHDQINMIIKPYIIHHKTAGAQNSILIGGDS